uniref:Uncharacterized protein n=1 Tax=Glossina austeni TaxID=7395 RepID=A0A1A9VBY5_GLOAU
MKNGPLLAVCIGEVSNVNVQMIVIAQPYKRLCICEAIVRDYDENVYDDNKNNNNNYNYNANDANERRATMI